MFHRWPNLEDQEVSLWHRNTFVKFKSQIEILHYVLCLESIIPMYTFFRVWITLYDIQGLEFEIETFSTYSEVSAVKYILDISL